VDGHFSNLGLQSAVNLGWKERRRPSMTRSGGGHRLPLRKQLLSRMSQSRISAAANATSFRAPRCLSQTSCKKKVHILERMVLRSLSCATLERRHFPMRSQSTSHPGCASHRISLHMCACYLPTHRPKCESSGTTLAQKSIFLSCHYPASSKNLPVLCMYTQLQLHRLKETRLQHWLMQPAIPSSFRCLLPGLQGFTTSSTSSLPHQLTKCSCLSTRFADQRISLRRTNSP